MYNVDWDQHKKNLELERSEWEKYKVECQIIDEETDKKIKFIQSQLESKIQELQKRFEQQKTKLEDDAKRLKNRKHKRYIQNVERKFEPSISDK